MVEDIQITQLSSGPFRVVSRTSGTMFTHCLKTLKTQADHIGGTESIQSVVPTSSGNIIRVTVGENQSDIEIHESSLLPGPRCLNPLDYRVKSIVERGGFVAIVGENAVVVFDSRTNENMLRLKTFTNPNGCAALSSDGGRLVLSCLGLQRGTVRIERISPQKSSSVIAAHESGIVALALSSNGAYVSTISESGSVIRVHSTSDPCDLLIELRRSTLLGTPKLDHLFMSPTGSFVGTVEGALISIFKTPISSTSHLTHPPDDTASSLSVLNSLTSAYQKCLGNAAWVTLKVPRMNADILSVTATFGADPFTVAIASLSHAGTNFFVYRFDPNEAGSITLGRCEQFSHTSEPKETLPEDDLVEVLKTSDQENRDQVGEDWIFLSNSDNFKQNISWYM